MIEIAALLGVASVAFGLAYYLRVPAVPFLLIAGVALGFSGLIAEQDFVEDVLILAVTLLLFIAGTDLSVRRVGDYRRVALQIGIVQFFLLGAMGIGAAILLGYVIEDALYLALALAASSTLIVIRLLAKRRQMFEPFGRATTGVLLVQDLLIILLIPVATRLPEGWLAAALGVGGTLLLVGLAAIMVRWVAPYLLQRLELDTESLLLVILSVLFVFMGIAWAIQVPLISAAFLAGVSLSGFPISSLVHGELRPISDFFTAVFFTALGTVIVVPGVEGLWHAVVFALVVIVVTPPLVTLIAERAGLTARSSLESGLLLSQTSEFSLVVGLQGLVLGQISQDLFTIIALTTVLTMIVTPIISSESVLWYLMKFHPLRTRGRPDKPPKDHILLLGGGETVLPLLETLLLSGHEVLVVDEDPGTVSNLRDEGVSCMRGDAGDPKVLKAAGADQARIIISTLARPRPIRPVYAIAGDTPVLVRVFEEDEEASVREMGGIPISFSQAAAEEFFAWFDKEIGAPDQKKEPA